MRELVFELSLKRNKTQHTTYPIVVDLLKYMKKLTIDQLMVLETLCNQQLCLTGLPRKTPRSLKQSLGIGIPESHHWHMSRGIRLSDLPRVRLGD
jgi:hypothetical protein